MAKNPLTLTQKYAIQGMLHDNTDIKDIAKQIFDYMDEDVIKHSGITDYIIEDLITDDNLMDRNAYTFFEEGIPVAAAAFELGLAVENYMMEQGG